MSDLATDLHATSRRLIDSGRFDDAKAVEKAINLLLTMQGKIVQQSIRHEAELSRLRAENESLRSDRAALLAVLEPEADRLREVAGAIREYPHRVRMLEEIATALEAALKGVGRG